MSLEELEKKLNYLLDREAIRDVVTTYCRGCDRLDRDIVLSTYHEDALDDHNMFVGNPVDFTNWMVNMHSTNHTATQHFIGNHLAEIDGNVAHAETYFVCSLMNKKGAPFTQMGGRYIDRLEKRNGKWALVDRRMLNDWSAPSINSVEAAKTAEGGANVECIEPFEWEVMAGGSVPARDKTDPSYIRPLHVAKERLTSYAEIKSGRATVKAAE